MSARRVRARPQARDVNTPIFGETRRAEGRPRVAAFPVDASTSTTTTRKPPGSSATSPRSRPTRPRLGRRRAALPQARDRRQVLEAAFLNAGIPCRLAQGRALAEDPVVAYVIAALRVIERAARRRLRDAFFAPCCRGPCSTKRARRPKRSRHDLRQPAQSHAIAPAARHDETARQIRRALADWRNLEALGQAALDARGARAGAAVASRRQDALGARRPSRRDHRSGGDSRGRRAAERLRPPRAGRGDGMAPARWAARRSRSRPCSPPSASRTSSRADDPPAGAERHRRRTSAPSGLALGVFKAAQLLEMDEFGRRVRDFTAIDLETTDNDTTRPRSSRSPPCACATGQIAETFSTLVKPRVPIAPARRRRTASATPTSPSAPYFEEIWPRFRAFCGEDVIVAHNGYEFDFRILQRMVQAIGPDERFDLCTYDTLPLARDLFPTSRKLVDLARQFGIPTGPVASRARRHARARAGRARAGPREALSRAQRRRSSTCSTTSASRSR